MVRKGSPAENGIKRCSTCEKDLPLEQFQKNKRSSDGYQNVCKDCKHDYWNAWHQKNYENPEYRSRLNNTQIRVGLNRSLKKYGLTKEQYEKLVSKGCGICGGPATGRGRYAFDHNHKTGKFRGLLCSHCNTAIGLMKDNMITLSKAMQYLAVTN